ncbi:MAG: hypothetical protein ACJA0Q_000080 [Saprospiraceae bacterium]|jgi:hypothetical protein
MKRTITILSIFAIALSATAQTPGYTATSLYDDFATAAEYSEVNPVDPMLPEGAYWWGKAALGTDPTANAATNLEQCFLDHKTDVTRSGNGKMDVIVTQGSKCWQPMGLSTKLDLSQNATFEIEVTNNSSTTSIYFNVAISDVNKKVINSNNVGANYALVSIAPGETKTLEGDFTGGNHKVWVNGNATLTSGLDFTQVVGLDLTFVNAVQPEANGWEPEAISDVSVSVNSVKIGLGSAASTSSVSIDDFSMYPNPSNGQTVNFSTQLETVQVYNSLGQLLLSEVNVSSIDVSTLTTGVYVVKTNLETKKLFVK